MEKNNCKQEVIKKYLKQGVLLSPKELDNIIQGKEPKSNTQTFPTKLKKTLSIKDINEYKNTKYQTIRDLISKKTKALSINKTKKTFAMISIIGMIKEITPSGFIIEDPTDEIEVVIKQKDGIYVDDVIGIILLAFALGIESISDAVWIGLRILLFFLIFLYLGLKVIDRILSLGEKIHLPKAFLSISIAILLLYSFFADKAGISGIIGAFVAGILIGQNVRSSKITDDVKAIVYGFFIHIFFVYIGSSLWEGTNTDIILYGSIIIIAVVIIIVGIIGKILGCAAGAKLSGMNNTKALQVGIGMIPRMELALIIVTTSISHGLIVGDTAHSLLLITIILTITTTLITPFLIKTSFRR